MPTGMPTLTPFDAPLWLDDDCDDGAEGCFEAPMPVPPENMLGWDPCDEAPGNPGWPGRPFRAGSGSRLI